MPPLQRLTELQKIFSRGQLREDETLKSFGMDISMKLIEVPGRILYPPALQYQASLASSLFARQL